MQVKPAANGLRQLRQERGLTLQAVSVLSGITAAEASMLERGLIQPRPDHREAGSRLGHRRLPDARHPDRPAHCRARARRGRAVSPSERERIRAQVRESRQRQGLSEHIPDISFLDRLAGRLLEHVPERAWAGNDDRATRRHQGRGGGPVAIASGGPRT